MIESDSFTASTTCSLIFSLKISSSESTKPPVSITSKFLSNHSPDAYTLSRVTPAVGLTIDVLLPHNLLKSVDFPTLGRPIMAIFDFLLISMNYTTK